MKKIGSKKLTLNRETLAELTSNTLDDVVGGGAKLPATYRPTQAIGCQRFSMMCFTGPAGTGTKNCADALAKSALCGIAKK